MKFHSRRGALDHGKTCGRRGKRCFSATTDRIKKRHQNFHIQHHPHISLTSIRRIFNFIYQFIIFLYQPCCDRTIVENSCNERCWILSGHMMSMHTQYDRWCTVIWMVPKKFNWIRYLLILLYKLCRCACFYRVNFYRAFFPAKEWCVQYFSVLYLAR